MPAAASTATVRIPGPLRGFTGGADEVRVTAGTVRAVLEELERRHEGILARILDEHGEIRRFVHVFLGEDDVARGGGLDATVPDGAIVTVIPAVAGGAA